MKQISTKWAKITFIEKMLVLTGGAFGTVVCSLLLAQLFVTATDFSKSTNVRDIALTLAAILGFPFLVWRSLIAAKQANVAEENLTTSLIERAVKGLSSEKVVRKSSGEDRTPNIEVRIGALMQLERISRVQASAGTQQGRSDHIQIMKIICAYIRENSKAERAIGLGLPDFERYQRESSPAEQLTRAKEIDEYDSQIRSRVEELKKSYPLRTDISMAVEVLGRRSAEQILAEADNHLPGNVSGYRLDLRHTNLQAIDLTHANLNNAILTGAVLDGAVFKNCNFRGADLSNVSLLGSKVTACDFSGAVFGSAIMDQTNAERTRFIECRMSGASLACSYFNGCAFIKSQMGGVNFEGASTLACDFSGVDFQTAKMIRTSFSHSFFDGAGLYNLDLYGSELDYCDIRNSVWVSSNLPARVSAVSVHFSDLRGCKITTDILDNFAGNKATLLPLVVDGVDLPWVHSHWESEPTHYTTLVQMRKDQGMSTELTKDNVFDTNARFPLKTGTPWPTDKARPWCSDEVSILDKNYVSEMQKWNDAQEKQH